MEHGPPGLDLAGRADVCPTMSGRDFELWHPLLALASWIESAWGARAAEAVARTRPGNHRRGRDESVARRRRNPAADLADAVRVGTGPTPHDILYKAQEADATAFKTLASPGVTARLKRYGMPAAQKSRKPAEGLRE